MRSSSGYTLVQHAVANNNMAAGEVNDPMSSGSERRRDRDMHIGRRGGPVQAISAERRAPQRKSERNSVIRAWQSVTDCSGDSVLEQRVLVSTCRRSWETVRCLRLEISFLWPIITNTLIGGLREKRTQRREQSGMCVPCTRFEIQKTHLVRAVPFCGLAILVAPTPPPPTWAAAPRCRCGARSLEGLAGAGAFCRRRFTLHMLAAW